MKKVQKFESFDGKDYDTQESCICADEKHKEQFIKYRIEEQVKEFLKEDGNELFYFKTRENGLKEYEVIDAIADGRFTKVVNNLTKFRTKAQYEYKKEFIIK